MKYIFVQIKNRYLNNYTITYCHTILIWNIDPGKCLYNLYQPWYQFCSYIIGNKAYCVCYDLNCTTLPCSWYMRHFRDWLYFRNVVHIKYNTWQLYTTILQNSTSQFSQNSTRQFSQNSTRQFSQNSTRQFSHNNKRQFSQNNKRQFYKTVQESFHRTVQDNFHRIQGNFHRTVQGNFHRTVQDNFPRRVQGNFHRGVQGNFHRTVHNNFHRWRVTTKEITLNISSTRMNCSVKLSRQLFVMLIVTALHRPRKSVIKTGFYLL